MSKTVCGMTLVFAAMLVSLGTVARADESDRRLMERMERLEQQVQRLTSTLERGKERFGHPPAPQPPRLSPDAPQPPPPPCPLCPAVANCARHMAGLVRFLIALAIVINILLAVWVYQDVRKRGEGRGIFIVLVLLAGLPAAILYAVVRLGDRAGDKPS